MGSWDVTCMASHVGIGAGDDVVVIWLVENTGKDGMLCYNNAFWTPLPYLTYGKYDDYGGVEGIHGHMLPKLLDYTKTHLHPVRKGDNQYHDIPVNARNLTAEYMYQANHEGRLFLKAPAWRKKYDKSKFINKAALRYVPLHRSFVDRLLAEWPHDDYDPDTFVHYDTYFPEACEQLAAEIPLWRKYVESMLKSLEGEEDLTEEHKAIIAASNAYMLRDGEAVRWDDRIKFRWLQYIDWTFNNQWQHTPQSHHTGSGFMKSILDRTDEDFFYDCVEYLKFQWIKHFIAEARMMWCPVVGGPQFSHDSYNANKFVGEFIVDTVSAELKKIADDEAASEAFQELIEPYKEKFKDSELWEGHDYLKNLFEWLYESDSELGGQSPKEWLEEAAERELGFDDEPVMLACERALEELRKLNSENSPPPN